MTIVKKTRVIKAISKVINNTDLYRRQTSMLVCDLWHIVEVGEHNWGRATVSFLGKNKPDDEDEKMAYFFSEHFISDLDLKPHCCDKLGSKNVKYLAKNVFGSPEIVFEFATYAFGFYEKKEDVDWIIVKVEEEFTALMAEKLLVDFGVV